MVSRKVAKPAILSYFVFKTARVFTRQGFLLKEVLCFFYAAGLAHINKNVAGMVIAFEHMRFCKVEVKVDKREFAIEGNILQHCLREDLDAAKSKRIQR